MQEKSREAAETGEDLAAADEVVRILSSLN